MRGAWPANQHPIRAVGENDLRWVRHELTRNWGRPQIWSIGLMYDADALPGFIAEDSAGERIGLATYSLETHVAPGECELVTLSSLVERGGVGGALIDAVARAAKEARCTRLYLTTTNDNLHALGFYQRRGWVLTKLHAGIIERARERYPGIPMIGMNGIPWRDELELELPREEWP